MLDNFREIYNKEFKRYKHEGGLVMLILNSREVRTFVYEVCKACLAFQSTTPADASAAWLCKCGNMNPGSISYCAECSERR